MVFVLFSKVPFTLSELNIKTVTNYQQIYLATYLYCYLSVDVNQLEQMEQKRKVLVT